MTTFRQAFHFYPLNRTRFLHPIAGVPYGICGHGHVSYLYAELA